MEHSIFGNLSITLLGCRSSRRCRRSEAGDFVALFDAEDNTTGEKGRLLYEYEWDGRDVVHESVCTDNPALTYDGDNSPSAHSAFDANQDDTGIDPMQGDCTHAVWGY